MMTVNYAKQHMEAPLEEAVDLAAAEGQDKEIKLSHHPDGFMQFSGAGPERVRRASVHSKTSVQPVVSSAVVSGVALLARC